MDREQNKSSSNLWLGEEMTVYYCTSDNVAAFLQLKPFSADTKPTKEQVEDIINMGEDEIDIETNHAWREKTITEEYVDFSTPRYTWGAGRPIFLQHRHLRDFDTDEGDKIEVWQGGEYVDYVSTKTEGRGNDYWLNNSKGILYIYKWYSLYPDEMRLTYRYGETTVPADIKKCAVLKAARLILMNEDYSKIMVDGETNDMHYTVRVNIWNKDINRIIRRRTEIRPL